MSNPLLHGQYREDETKEKHGYTPPHQEPTISTSLTLAVGLTLNHPWLICVLLKWVFLYAYKYNLENMDKNANDCHLIIIQVI